MLPIVTRELRQAARQPKSCRNRVLGSLLAILVALGVLSPSFRGAVPPTETGRLLFYILSLVPFACVLLAGAYITADALSEEKRNGTLGLLFLTDLRGYDVVFGKLLATSLNPFYALLGTVPILALPLLLGGTMAGEFWRMVLVLVNTLFWSLAIGIFVSSCSKEGRGAWLGTIALILFFALAPWSAVKPLSSFTPGLSNPWPLLFSPIYACWLAFDGPYAAAGDRFSAALQVQHVLAWLFLMSASVIVPRSWQERSPSGWRLRLRTVWDRLTLGTSEEREVHRRRWMDQNPMLWLAQRERHRRAFFWGFLALFAGGWLLGYVVAEDAWVQPESMFLITFVLHLIVKVWIALEASRRLSQDKRSGALELLLVTPIGLPKIVSGIVTAARRQFLIPLGCILVLDVFLLAFGLNEAGGNPVSPLSIVFLAFVGMFLADSYALVWIGLWQGLKAPNSMQAFLRSLLLVLFLPWLLFVLISSMIAIVFFDLQGGAPFGGWLVAVWFAVAYFLDALLCGRAMFRLTDGFRLAATLAYQPPTKSWWPFPRWKTKRADERHEEQMNSVQ